MVDSRFRSGKKSISPARRGSIRLALLLGALVVVNGYVFLWREKTSIPAVMEKAKEAEKAPAPAPTGPADAAADGDAAAATAAARVEGEVSKGDTVGKILKASGLAAADADEVLRALSSVFDFKTLRPGQRFTIERAADGSVAAFELQVSKIKTVRVERDGAGNLIGVADVAQTRIEVEEVGGTIARSLYASIKAAGESTELVSFFVDVFAYDLDFHVDQHPGDEFRVVVEKEYKDQELLRYRRILAAEYAGKAGRFGVYYWQHAKQKTGRYFDETGQSVEKSLLKTPLKFSRVSSGFNPKRMHPVLHTVRGHYGVDYAAPTGTPVWAAAGGVITTRAFSGGAGNLVVLKHDNGLVTKYMHLSKFAPGQKVGQRVEAKTVIGFVGSTGLSTGPHLHFGVVKDGVHVDPLKLAPIRGRGVAKEELAAYKRHVSELQRRLRAIRVTDPGPAANAADSDGE
jgi:murein DD-endopeptidase MepM/ murein hydrolase activator NlpD